MATVKEAMRASVHGLRDVGKSGPFWTNYVVPEVTLQETLGQVDERPSSYNLYSDTRDILIAHTRQDSAHALANTGWLIKEVEKVRWMMSSVVCLGFGLYVTDKFGWF